MPHTVVVLGYRRAILSGRTIPFDQCGGRVVGDESPGHGRFLSRLLTLPNFHRCSAESTGESANSRPVANDSRARAAGAARSGQLRQTPDAERVGRTSSTIELFFLKIGLGPRKPRQSVRSAGHQIRDDRIRDTKAAAGQRHAAAIIANESKFREASQSFSRQLIEPESGLTRKLNPVDAGNPS